MGLDSKYDESEFFVDSRYEHKKIPGLLRLDLPIESEYNGKLAPFDMVLSARFRDANYPGLESVGTDCYFPADLRIENGEKVVYDLLLGEKDEELSFLFETQPNLTKLVADSIDRPLMMNHLPDKAKGKYFFMPETLAIVIDNNVAYYRLIPSLTELSEERALKHTIYYERMLGVLSKIFLDDSNIKSYSLTPDVQEIKEKQEDYARKVDAGIPVGVNEKLDALLKGQQVIMDKIDDSAELIIASIPSNEENEFMWTAYNALINKMDKLEDVFNQNDKIYGTLKKLKKKTGKVEDALEVALGKLLEDKVSLNLKLKKGFDKGDVYVAKNGKTFKLLGTVQPLSDEFKFKKLKSNLEIKNAMYNDEPKEMKDGYIKIKDELGMNELGELELIIATPEQQLDFETTVIGKVKVEGKEYSIMRDSEKITIKPGNVTKEQAKKWGKRILKFAVPRIAKALKE